MAATGYLHYNAVWGDVKRPPQGTYIIMMYWETFFPDATGYLFYEV